MKRRGRAARRAASERCGGARAAATGGRHGAASSPPRCARPSRRRGPEAGPRSSRRSRARDPSTASGGNRRAHRAHRPARRSGAARAALGRARSGRIGSVPRSHRDAERAERGLERCPIPLDARADKRDLLRARAAPDQGQQLLGDPLERPSAAGAFEEAKRAVDLRGFGGRRRREERSLKVRECRWAHIGSRRQLLDPGPRELRRGRQRFARATRRQGGRARTGSETVTSARPASASSSAHCAPVRSSKPYAKTGRPSQAPARRQPVRRPRGAEGRGPRAPAGRARPGSRRRARRDRRRARPARRARTRARRASKRAHRRSRRTGRAVQPVQPRMRNRPADDQRPLCVGRDGTMLAARPSRADGRGRRRCRSDPPAAPEAASSSRSTRSTSDRFGTIRKGSRRAPPIALQQEGDFAGIRRPGQEGQGHRPILDLPSDGISYRVSVLGAGRE